MSSHNDSGMDNPIAGIEAPKSSKKLWMYGGLGCLGIIGLVCIGFVVLAFFVGNSMLEFQQQTVDDAVALPAVQEILGSPVSAGPAVPTQVQGEPQTFSFRAPLKGSNAEGTLIFDAKLEGGTTWVRNSLLLESGGEQTDLEQEGDIFNLQIDDGQ